MNVVVLAPIQNSLYSRLVTFLLSEEQGIDVSKVVVRTPWTWSRMRSEIRRDGMRLVRKAYKKLVLKERAYELADETIFGMAKRLQLPGKNLDQLGRERGISVVTVKDHNDDVSLSEIRTAKPDIIVFTGGGLLRKPLLDIPTDGVLNCHMGFLPRYRGMDVVEWPILEADHPENAPVGMTVHFMDQGVDTGDILQSKAVAFADLQSFKLIRERFEPQMVELMVDTVKRLRDGTIERLPQAMADGRQYFLMHPRLYEVAELMLQNNLNSSIESPTPLPSQNEMESK